MLTPTLLLAFLLVPDTIGLPVSSHEKLYEKWLKDLSSNKEAAKTDDNWREYKLKHRKVNKNPGMEAVNYDHFSKHHKKIEDFNNRYNESYVKGVNHFSDMTHEQFKKAYTKGYKVPTTYLNGAEFTNEMHVPTNDTVPSHVNWVTQGLVTRVKNQAADCLSCYAFSSTGALEGQWMKQTGELRELSEQNLIDCTKKKYQNDGCEGGWMDNNFKYIKDNHGIDSESYYPYVGVDWERCYFNRSQVAAYNTGFKDIPYGDENALQHAVATVGPISVAIDASHESFMHYSVGVYKEDNCGNELGNLNHAVLVVGYGTEYGLDYWLVKNSWGTTWGDNGYIKMARNRNNQCGIATKASYPTVIAKRRRHTGDLGGIFGDIFSVGKKLVSTAAQLAPFILI